VAEANPSPLTASALVASMLSMAIVLTLPDAAWPIAQMIGTDVFALTAGGASVRPSGRRVAVRIVRLDDGVSHRRSRR
jgi:hypothetical protein